MPKFFNWPMPLNDIQYSISKADIISLPILPLNHAKISETIEIQHYLVERLGLENIIENKVVPIKADYLTVRNVTRVLYQKQSKLN